MSYVNVGAKARTADNGSYVNVATKKALRELIGAIPSQVVLYGTGIDNEGELFYCDTLPVGPKFTVVGPDPYTSRKWYATVERTNKGVTVK